MTAPEFTKDVPPIEDRRKRRPRRRAEDRLYTAVLVLIVCVVLLIPACLVLAGVVNKGIDLLYEVKAQNTEQIALQKDSAVRGCAFAATNGQFFASSCLEPETLDGYGRDVVDFLDPEDPDEGLIRARICNALTEQGVSDTDCV